MALLGALTLSLNSCKKDENLNKEIVGLGGDTWAKGPIDDWIYTNFTQPFNIEVKYRWDRSELALDRTLVPVKEEKVIPIMDMVKKAWVDVYVDEAGAPFVKQLAPKQYVLVGSPQYNSGGTITLGEAEGGRKITLFTVNDFDVTNTPLVQRVLKTIHHEFGHILQQNIAISKDFQLITPSGYTADWNNTTLAEAYAAGYISQYAQAAPNEDFVEMLSIMLTQGKFGYETTLKSVPTAALPKIRAKENNVISYLKQAWNIEVSRLQNRTFIAINNFKEIPASNYFGFGKTYSLITYNPDNPDVSAAFKALYETTKAEMISKAGGRAIQSFSVAYTNTNEFTLKVNYVNTANAAFTATFVFTATTDATAKTTFTLLSQDGNATVISAGVKPLTDYFLQNQFKLDYFYSADLKTPYIGFRKFNDASNYFVGVIGN